APWSHPPLAVEQRLSGLRVVQGKTSSRVGFVRRGDSVEMLSRDADYHALRARGSAFFSLTFPDPDRPRRRTLAEKGIVELSSGAGHWWLRGYLFVDDHPYYARTDTEGRFRLAQVPAGRYRLVCWAPSWLKQSWDRDPETSLLIRLSFRPPVVQERDIEVRSG